MEYLNYALENHAEGALKGEAICSQLVEIFEPFHSPLHHQWDQAAQIFCDASHTHVI
jgi:hypothetical protein